MGLRFCEAAVDDGEGDTQECSRKKDPGECAEHDDADEDKDACEGSFHEGMKCLPGILLTAIMSYKLRRDILSVQNAFRPAVRKRSCCHRAYAS